MCRSDIVGARGGIVGIAGHHYAVSVVGDFHVGGVEAADGAVGVAVVAPGMFFAVVEGDRAPADARPGERDTLSGGGSTVAIGDRADEGDREVSFFEKN
jgi:hypothetical protein